MKRFARRLFALPLLFASGHSRADVIYSGLQDITIPTTYQGINVDVDGVGGWDLNPFMGGVYLYNNTAFQPARDGTGGMDTVLNFTTGSIISSSLNFATGTGGSMDHLGGQFTAGNEGYLGFKLNGTDYGWMRVVFTNNNTGALIKDWAYNTGGSIATGNVVQNGSTVTLNSAFGSFTLGSQITASNNVVKSGAGTTTLTGLNDFSGTTSVDAGTLALASGASLSNTGSVIVGANATLAGHGTIGGATTIEGIHSPGSSPGLQTFEDGISYTTGAIVDLEFTANTLGLRGTDFDGINVTGGALSIADGVTSTLVFNGAGSGVEWADEFWDLSRSWLVYQNTNSASLDSLAIFDTINVSLDSTGATLTGSRGAFSWDQQGDNVHLVYTAVPEPGAALLGGLGLLMLLRRRR